MGGQAASQRVSQSCSVISSSYNLLERAGGVSKTAVSSLCALGGFGASDPGHERERGGGEQMTIDGGKGRAMKSKMRGGMDWTDEEARGEGGGGCALYK